MVWKWKKDNKRKETKMKTFKIKVSYFNLGMGIEERQEYEIKARTERAATSKVYR